MSRSDPQLNARVNRELLEEFQEFCKDSGVSQTKAINESLRSYLNRHKVYPDKYVYVLDKIRNIPTSIVAECCIHDSYTTDISGKIIFCNELNNNPLLSKVFAPIPALHAHPDHHKSVHVLGIPNKHFETYVASKKD